MMMKTSRTIWVAVLAVLTSTANAQLLTEEIDGGETWQIVTGNDPTSVYVSNYGNHIQVIVTSYRLEDLNGRHLSQLSDDEVVDLADTMEVRLRVAEDVERIECRLGESGDFFAASEDLKVSVEVYGGPGIDMIGGSSQDDELDGGPDADVLIGGPGKDSLYGGADGAEDHLIGNEGPDLFFVGCIKAWRRTFPDKKSDQGKQVTTLPTDWRKLLADKKVPNLQIAWVTANVNTSEPLIDPNDPPSIEEYCIQEDLVLDLNVDEGDLVIDIPVE